MAARDAADPAKGVIDRRLDSVQMLRAVAALSVVALHTTVFAGIGNWGVTLFFVVSGFIMCHVTADSSAHFLRKRIIRIVPLYWLGTLGVFAVAVLAPTFVQNTTSDVGELVKSLLFIPFVKGENVQPVLYLGWTLNYEMFFYMLFALSMRLSHRYRAVLCSLMLVALVMVGRIVQSDSVIFQFYTAPIMLDFVLGMACFAVLRRTGQPRGGRWRAAATLAGTACLVALPIYANLVPGSTRLTPSATDALPIAALAAGALGALVLGLAGKRLPLAIVLIGDASYSLYLFHPYVIQLFGRVFRSFDAPGLPGVVFAVLAITLCCVLAVALFIGLERPLTRYLRRRFVGEDVPVSMVEPADRPSPAIR